MPFFLISITLKNKKVMAGVRFDQEKDIERVWQKYEYKALEKFGSQMDTFIVYGLSKRSPEVKQYLAATIKDSFSVDIPELKLNEPPGPESKSRKQYFAEQRPLKKG